MLHRTLQDLCSSWHLVIDQINIVLTTISAIANFQAILNISCLETIFHISQFHPKQNLINGSSHNVDVLLLIVSCSSRLCHHSGHARNQGVNFLSLPRSVCLWCRRWDAAHSCWAVHDCGICPSRFPWLSLTGSTPSCCHPPRKCLAAEWNNLRIGLVCDYCNEK